MRRRGRAGIERRAACPRRLRRRCYSGGAVLVVPQEDGVRGTTSVAASWSALTHHQMQSADEYAGVDKRGGATGESSIYVYVLDESECLEALGASMSLTDPTTPGIDHRVAIGGGSSGR
eukprot:6386167-Pyramimonas_sp.AAC.1